MAHMPLLRPVKNSASLSATTLFCCNSHFSQITPMIQSRNPIKAYGKGNAMITPQPKFVSFFFILGLPLNANSIAETDSCCKCWYIHIFCSLAEIIQPCSFLT